MQFYFVIGMFSTLGLNTLLGQVVDQLAAGLVSVVGGMASAAVVAWLKRRWDKDVRGTSPTLRERVRRGVCRNVMFIPLPPLRGTSPTLGEEFAEQSYFTEYHCTATPSLK